MTGINGIMIGLDWMKISKAASYSDGFHNVIPQFNTL